MVWGGLVVPLLQILVEEKQFGLWHSMGTNKCIQRQRKDEAEGLQENIVAGYGCDNENQVGWEYDLCSV